ncbi:MAG: hypothetical protein ACJ79H_09180 [Myxococcales bacterium]
MRAARTAVLLLAACRASPPSSPPPAAAPDGQAVSCVEQWLAQRDLNQYGDPLGTMYAGGTPLFDERTGQTTDRMRYLVRKHPELQQACPAEVLKAHAP